MAYKMVDNLEKLCGEVAGAAIEHRELITAAFVERYKHKLEEGQIPDIFQLITWLAEELHEHHGEVVAGESGLKAELTEDRQDRILRGRWGSELREHLFSARRVFDGIYGAGGAEVMFQEPPGFRIRVDPVPLYRQGATVHDNILNPSFRRPPLRFDLEPNLEKLARGMEPSLEGLKHTLEALRTGTQASKASLAAKDTQMAKLDKRTGLGVRWLEATLAWAEHEGLARRVRQSSHRPQGDPAEAPDSLTAADSAGDLSPEGEAPEGETAAGTSNAPNLRTQGERTRPPATEED